MGSNNMTTLAERPVGRFVDGVAFIGGIVALGVAGFVFVDVILRSLSIPFLGAREVMTMALVVIVSCGFASGAAHGIHLSVDALASVLGRRARLWQLAIANTLSIAALGFLAWRALNGGIEARDFGDSTMLLRLPHGPFYFALSAGFVLQMLVLTAEFVALAPENPKDHSDAQ